MYDVITIGDAMKDIFVFPSIDEMEKPIEGGKISPKDKDASRHTKFLVFGYGDKITISDIHYDVGGTACNVAAGLAKLGLKTSIITTLGKDNEAQEILEKLRRVGVNTSNIKINKEKKTSFSVIISYKGERSILVFHSFGPEDFIIPKELETGWIYLGPVGEGYKSLYSKITSSAAEKNIKVALNPGAVQIHDGLISFGGLLRVTKILFVNKEEGQKLAGISGVSTPREIIEKLLAAGPEIVVITDGKEGAYAATEEEFFKVGAYPANKVESTGAGDAFASAFLFGIIKDEKIFDCLKWGVVNSASAIEKYGAQEGLLGITTIKRRAKEHKWPADTLRFS